jgi:hypothetical protein
MSSYYLVEMKLTTTTIRAIQRKHSFQKFLAKLYLHACPLVKKTSTAELESVV